MWEGVITLIGEVKACERAGATTAAVAMSYVCIDAMAFLSLPAGRETQGRADFISWVNKYLTCHEDQPYKYAGIDVYGAGCALLHAFGAEAGYHQQYPVAKRFVYHDGGKHAFDPAHDNRLVVIGTASFLNDVVQGVQTFMEACRTDAALGGRVTVRLPRLLANFPFTATPVGT